MSKATTVPDWLNESFLQTVLQQDGCRDKEVTVNTIEVTHAVSAGDNYTSDMFRVRGTYQEEHDHDQSKEISVIVKFVDTTSYIGKYLDEQGVIMKEYIAYREFLPEVYKFLPKSERFTAKLLYSPEPKTLVLEDLKSQGFVMADRLKQLDFKHCLICIKSLAKFHACSVAVLKNKPEFIAKLGKEWMYDKKNIMAKYYYKEMYKNVICSFAKAVQNWEGFDDFEEKSCRVWETLTDDLYEVFEPRKDSLNVMNHGDLWTNNMMFKYDDDGNIVDFRVVDLQLCRYTSPVTDLVYFIFTSANEDVRENRLEELFSVYLETLNSVLEQLDCEEKLTREQLDAELKRYRCYVFTTTFTNLCLVLSDPDDLMTLDELNEDNVMSKENNPFEKSYYGKYYKVIAAQVLRYLYRVGFFER